MTAGERKRIAVTMNLYREEYDTIVRSKRCGDCKHLDLFHHWENMPAQGVVCEIEGCECLQ